MIKCIYSDSIAPVICAHEDKLMDVYLGLINGFQNKFNKYQCSVLLKRYWYNPRNKTVSSERIPFSAGYMCAFSCSIERNGKIVCIDEVEGNMLTVSWTISYIGKERLLISSRKPCLVVSMFDDTDEVISDLDEFLRLLDNI